MPSQWKCARCSTKNPESTLTCSACRMIRGAVVVPGTYEPRFATERPSAPARPAEWAAHASGRPRLLGPVSIGAAVLVALLIAGTVTAWFDTTPVPIARPTATAQPVGVVNLQVGDCFDVVLASVESYSGLTPRACTEAHEYEVYWTGAMPAGYYPSDEAFEAFYHANCLDAFGKYVGEVWTDTKLDSFWMVPDPEDWAAGVRSVQCSVCDPAHPRLTSSLRGARPSRNESIPL